MKTNRQTGCRETAREGEGGQPKDRKRRSVANTHDGRVGALCDGGRRAQKSRQDQKVDDWAKPIDPVYLGIIVLIKKMPGVRENLAELSKFGADSERILLILASIGFNRFVSFTKPIKRKEDELKKLSADLRQLAARVERVAEDKKAS